MSSTQDETLIIIPEWSDGPANNSPDQIDRQSLNEIAMNLDRSWTRKILLPGFSEPQIISDITHHVFHIPPDPERHLMLFWGRAKYMVFTHQSLTISFGTCIHEISLVIPREILDQNHWSFEYLFGRLLMFCGQIEEDTDLEPFRELKEQKEYCWRVKIEHWGQAALISPKNAGTILERFGEQWESCPEPDEGILSQASYEAEMKELTWATDPGSEYNKRQQRIETSIQELEESIEVGNRKRQESRHRLQESLEADNRKQQESLQRMQRAIQIIEDLTAKRGKTSAQQSMTLKDIPSSSPPVEPLENDWNNLYARTSDFLNRNDIESIFISGSVDSADDREPDIHITRSPSGGIGIDTDDGSGEGDYIYSSHIGIDGKDYPSPNLASSVTDEQITRLNAVLDGEVDIHAPSSWDIYMTTGKYGTYKPQENTLGVGVEEHHDHTTLNVEHKGLKGRVVLQVGPSETPNFPIFQGSGYYVEGMPSDRGFVELLNASFEADFKYQRYPEFNTLSPGSSEWRLYLDESFEDLRTGYISPDPDENIPKDTVKKLIDAYAEAFEKVVGTPDQARESAIEKEPSFYQAAIDYMGLGLKINAQAEKTIPSHGDRGEVTVEQHQDRIVMHHSLPEESSKRFDTIYMSNPNKGVDYLDYELTYDQKKDLMLAMQGGQDKGLCLDRQEQTQDKPSFEELEQSYSVPDATCLNHGVEPLPTGQENPRENQPPNTEFYQSLYKAANKYGDFEAGFNLLDLGNGYSFTTNERILNVFKDDEVIIHVLSANPGPFDGELQEPLHIADKTTPEQREELQIELLNLGQRAERNLEKPHQETPIAEGAIALMQIQELDKPQGTETPKQPTHNIFWITEEGRYLNSKMTCVKTNKTHAQVKHDVYYLLSEAGEIINREWGSGIDETQPENEGICHLLIKYYGYELCKYDKSAIEIDTAWVWEAEDPDIPARDKNWLKWLDITHFRFGLYSELTALIRHDTNVSRMEQYPWSDVHQSVTGWDCGDYIIEVPFCQFNSAEDAKQYGRQCLGLYSAPGYDTVARLRSSKPRIESDLDPDPIFSKKDLILLEHPNPGQPVDYSDRDSWTAKDSNNKDMFIPSNCKRLYAEAIPLRA